MKVLPVIVAIQGLKQERVLGTRTGSPDFRELFPSIPNAALA